MVETTWRWVQGDDRDPAEKWLLVERTRNDAMGMTSTVDRTILVCGQVEAGYQVAIKSVPAMIRRIRQLEEQLSELVSLAELDDACRPGEDIYTVVEVAKLVLGDKLVATHEEDDADGQ